MTNVKTAKRLLCAAGAVALVGIALSAYLATTLTTIPPGSAIRPMGHASGMLLISIVTLCFASTWAIIAITLAHKKRLIWIMAIFVILISLCPFPLSKFIAEWIVESNNLIMKQ